MGDTRWLDAGQQRSWRAYVDGSAELAERLDRVLRTKHKLTMPEYEILVRLSEADNGAARMAELASSVSHSRSRLSHTIARLERDGYVRRESCETDGRGVLAVLTPAGRVKLDQASHDHVTSVREYFVDVVDPADLEAVGRAFTAVARKLHRP